MSRQLKRLMQDPDRWVDADVQRKLWLYKGIRLIAVSALLTFAVLFAGLYLRTHGS